VAHGGRSGALVVEAVLGRKALRMAFEVGAA